MSVFLFSACFKKTEYVTFIAPALSDSKTPSNPEEERQKRMFKTVYDRMSPRFKTNFRDGNTEEFLSELKRVLEGDRDGLLLLCDKTHSLPDGYEPKDLVLLESNDSYNVNRTNLYLRSCAQTALEEMGTAARKAGITILVSSSYRSYDYQVTVYNRLVEQDGQEAADRESAKPGTSQHQTGTVVDFGSIDSSYEQTKPGRWLLDNAARFGWSLSFPDGYEDVTGYRYECWHFRYIGKEACAFQEKWFNNVQQFMLEFIDEWKNEVKNGVKIEGK